MRNLHRILSTVVAVGAIFPVGLPVASAAEVKLPVEIGAWFWDDQQDDTSVASLPAAASGVPLGDLAVAITSGAAQPAEVHPGEKPDDPSDDQDQKRSNKESFLMWDLSAYPEGSIVEKFLVTLFVDPAGQNIGLPALDLSTAGQPDRGGQPNIIACRPLVGFGEGDGIGYVSKPGLDCRDSFSGSYDATTNSYTFDIAVYAQDWIDGLIDNRGIGIRPEVDEDDPFQVTFFGPAKVLTLAEIIPGELEEEIPDLAPLPDVNVDSGFTGGGTTFEPSIPVVEAAPAPAPVANPAPVAPKPAVQFFNRAARPVDRDLTVAPSFWLALVAGVGLLGLVSLILGDPVVPVRGQRTNARTGRTSPVGETLRARRAGVAVRPRSI